MFDVGGEEDASQVVPVGLEAADRDDARGLVSDDHSPNVDVSLTRISGGRAVEDIER